MAFLTLDKYFIRCIIVEHVAEDKSPVCMRRCRAESDEGWDQSNLLSNCIRFLVQCIKAWKEEWRGPRLDFPKSIGIAKITLSFTGRVKSALFAASAPTGIGSSETSCL